MFLFLKSKLKVFSESFFFKIIIILMLFAKILIKFNFLGGNLWSFMHRMFDALSCDPAIQRSCLQAYYRRVWTAVCRWLSINGLTGLMSNLSWIVPDSPLLPWDYPPRLFPQFKKQNKSLNESSFRWVWVLWISRNVS